jgi:hypothetical protein
MFPGCQWFNNTDLDPTGALAGQCGPNAKESYGESGWKGILMALLGNIIIKCVCHTHIAHDSKEDLAGSTLKQDNENRT